MSFICRDERYGAARLAGQSKCSHLWANHEKDAGGQQKTDAVQVSELMISFFFFFFENSDSL